MGSSSREIDPAGLRSSLASQPLLAILRPRNPEQLLAEVGLLHAIGWQHVEIAWTAPWLPSTLPTILDRFPGLRLGAASVTTEQQLREVIAAKLPYAFMPIWQPALWSLATTANITLVPGVFSPTEIHQAQRHGCSVVKLFPASILGPCYWNQLEAPLGSLPFCVAAGGLDADAALQWLRTKAVNAVAVGRQLLGCADSDHAQRRTREQLQQLLVAVEQLAGARAS